tara:strand:- start:354 stop:1181 length:828 start_codon:yes stop_codon:yes gene_type:complete
MNSDITKFKTEGYLGPFNLNDQSDFTSLLQEKYIPKNLYTWYKSPHEKSKGIIKLASDKNILEKLKNVLSNDILLWGSLFVDQKPSNQHVCHLDVEHGSWDGATVWIGLKNLNEKTSLSLITHTHLLNTAPIELQKKNDIDCKNDQAVLEEAKKLDPRCELKNFYLKKGEFIIWSGRVWHSTFNRSKKTRQSIILQYCTPNNKVKIPTNFNYPDTGWSKTEPPCILISGEDKYNLNKILYKKDIKFVQRFKILTIYNLRYKMAYLFRKIKAIFYN